MLLLTPATSCPRLTKQDRKPSAYAATKVVDTEHPFASMGTVAGALPMEDWQACRVSLRHPAAAQHLQNMHGKGEQQEGFSLPLQINAQEASHAVYVRYPRQTPWDRKHISDAGRANCIYSSTQRIGCLSRDREHGRPWGNGGGPDRPGLCVHTTYSPLGVAHSKRVRLRK